MSHRLTGYFPLVTITGTTVAFPKGQVSRMWFRELLTDGSHYLYNITKGEFKTITGKSGMAQTGVSFTVASVGSWVTGDEVYPVKSNSAARYLTLALAIAAAVDPDVGILGFTTSARTFSAWLDYGGYVQPVGTTWEGMLDAQKTILGPCGPYGDTWSAYYGQGSSEWVRNVTWNGDIRIGNNSPAGEPYSIPRFIQCVFESNGTIYAYNLAGAPVQLESCLFNRVTASYGGLYAYNCLETAINCTFYRCSRCFSIITGTIHLKNCAVLLNGLPTPGAVSTADHCVETGSELPAGTGNVQNATEAQIAAWDDNDNGYHLGTGRVKTSSIAAGAGAHVTGVDRDIDDNDITVNCPAGCHVALDPFGVSWPAANQVKTGNDFTSFAGAQTASYSPPAGGSSFNGGFN